jgi:uncharacterized lipoprotein YmbA
MTKVRTVWRLIGGSVAITLSACHSAPTRIYGIDAAAPTTRINIYQAPAIRVDSLNVPASWDRIEILTFSAGKLQINDFDHWSAPLAKIARQALSQDLDRRLPAGSVIYPRLPKTGGALGVDVDILEFDVVGSQASMQASWLIVAGAGSHSAKRGVASLQGPTTSTEPAAIAHAWSDLIGQLADRIAVDAASFATP